LISTQVIGFKMKNISWIELASILKFIQYKMTAMRIFNRKSCLPGAVSSYTGLSKLKSVLSAKIDDPWAMSKGTHKMNMNMG